MDDIRKPTGCRGYHQKLKNHLLYLRISMAHYSPATLTYVLLSALALLATASPVRRARQDHPKSLQDVMNGLWVTSMLAVSLSLVYS